MTNEEARRASGRKMEEDRRASGRKMRDDMRALAENNRLERTLPSLPARGNQPARRGAAAWQAAGSISGGGGGGIASPLTEEDFSSRTYHEPSVLLSGDFLLGVQIKPISQITMTDADGQVVLMRYAKPVATP